MAHKTLLASGVAAVALLTAVPVMAQGFTFS